MERSYIDQYDCACNSTDNSTHLHNLCKNTFDKNQPLSTTIRGIDFMFGTRVIQPYKKEMVIGFSELFFVFLYFGNFVLGIAF